MNRSTVFASVVSITVASATMFAASCGGDDEEKPAAVDDAAVADVTSQGDPCASYTKVGSACRLPPGRVCFAQCTSGGCFCENGLWACRTDTSCFRDVQLFEDVSEVPDDAASDAPLDVTGDSELDASDASADVASDASADAADDVAAD